jgi:MYXO-CTERM domain-containing protein
MKYDAEVGAAAAKWGPHYGVAVDPHLIHAIIQAESSHGAKLVTDEPGGRRSYGPMMVLDTTAAGMGVVDPSLLRDPQLGIWYGVRYFAAQLKAFAGDTARAVSAYNAGPGNAKRSSSGQFPNQAYVNRVLAYWRLYGPAGAATGGALALAFVALFLARRRKEA